MAFNKEEKNAMLDEYEQWVRKSQAMFVLEYSKMNMKLVNDLRKKTREAGGELHVVKNTLMEMALQRVGVEKPAHFEGSSLVGFAFGDVAALAKVFNDAAKNADVFKVKGGYLGTEKVSAQQVKALADLPPLPVMRAQLLGMLLAPASQLVRTLAEPARQVARALQAYSEKESAPAA